MDGGQVDMLESILAAPYSTEVFRFTSYQSDEEFMRESGWSEKSREEMVALLRSCDSSDSLEELCEEPFRPRRLIGRKLRRTRFSDGSFPVFYCAVDAETAEAEARHGFCKLAGGRGGRRAWYRCFACDFDGTVKDLRQKLAEWCELTHDTDYGFCNALGAEAKREGLDGLLVPSARRSGGTNVPVLKRSAISRPRILEPVEFVSPAMADG